MWDGLFNTTLTPSIIGLGVWDINGGWPKSRNLIAGGPMDIGGGSDTIL